MSEEKFPKIIELNVGGVHYSTALETLRSDSESMLCAMFSGRMGVTQDKSGRYFIDRDGSLFKYVLNYLRKGACALPTTEWEREQLREEAEFYQLQGLTKLLSSVQLGVTMGKKSIQVAMESKFGQGVLQDVDRILMPFIEEATSAGAAALEIQFGYNYTNAFMELVHKPYQTLRVPEDQSGYKKVCEYMKDPIISRLVMNHFQKRGFIVSFTVSIQSLWMKFDIWEAAAYQNDSTRKVEQILSRMTFDTKGKILTSSHDFK